MDFGAGTGLMLRTLGEVRTDAELIAIEPFMPPAPDPRLHYAPAMAAIAARKVDLVTAFEVCEHLGDDDLDDFLSRTAGLLQLGGFLIVSVPIVIGPVVVLKEINHMILFRRPSELSAGEMARLIFGLPIDRPEDRNTTHKGFDFRWLRHQLLKRFVILKQFYAPLPLPWWLNSQAFFICQAAAN